MRSRLAAMVAVTVLLPLWAQAPQGGLRVPAMQYQLQQLRPGLSIVVSPNPSGSAAAPVVAILTLDGRGPLSGAAAQGPAPATPGYQQTLVTVPAGQLTSVLSDIAARLRFTKRAVVVVAGAIDPPTVLAQAAHIFAACSACGPTNPRPDRVTAPRSHRPKAPPPQGATPHAPMVMTLTWPGPGADAKDGAALAMLGEDLFGGPAAREHRSLVDKWRAALEVGGGLNGAGGWDSYQAPGQFRAQVWFRPAVSSTLVRELVFRQIHEVEVNGISANELRLAKIWTAADWLRRGQTAAARARRLARAFWETGSPDAANDALRPMLDVTAAQMQAAAARYLGDAQAAIRVSPAPPPGRATARTPGGLPHDVGQAPAPPSGSPRPIPAWIPAWRPPAAAFDAQFQNGLRLVVIPDANQPLITARLSVRAAPISQAGWSRALARVLLAGTVHEPGAALADRMQGIGGTLWARAGVERFTIGASALSPYAGILLRRLAAVAIRPAIPAAAVAREQLNAPAWRAWRQRNPLWLARHVAYRWLEAAQALPAASQSQRKLAAFAHQLLLPNNDARLVVVGNVDPAWVESLVEQYFVDAWPFGSPPALARRKNISASRLFLVNVPGARAAFFFASAAPPPGGAADFAARLLVRRMALGAGAVSGVVPAAQLPAALRQALIGRARLGAAPPPARQLQAVKARLIRSWMNAWQTQGQIADAWNQTPDAGQPSALWAAIAAATPARLQAAARRDFSPAVIVVVGDAAVLEAPLFRLRQAPIPILDTQGRRIGVYPPNGTPAR